MNRREFLELIGLGAAGSVVFGACGPAQEKKDRLVSPLARSDEPSTGTPDWYASVCQQCPSGCGIVVRVMEGRAKKIEGNPIHPVNQGKLCARGQAALQVLYNPDRVRRPLKQVGSRGSGQFVETSWDEGLAAVAERLSAIQSANSPDRLLFLTGALSGHQAPVFDRFARAFGASGCVAYELFGYDAYYAANRLVFGREALPDYDLDNAGYVLSFGANFLETWVSPVRFGRGFGAMRQGRPGRRGKLVQVEPRLSLTASRADEWVPIAPGTEGLLALGIARAIVSEGLAPAGNAQLPPTWRNDLLQFSPDRVAARTGVPEERIRRLAREYASSRPGLAMGGASVAGHTNGVGSLVAINALNVLTGSVGVEGGVRFVRDRLPSDLPSRAETSYAGLSAAVEKLNSGVVDTVLVYGTNPVFTSPPGLGLSKALDKAKLVVAFSSFLDETSSLADLILPDSTFLESWGDQVPEYGAGSVVYSTAQPVVSHLYETRPATDVLLGLARTVGGTASQALPWSSTLDILKEFSGQLQALGRGPIREADAERFWAQLLRRGGWWEVGDVAGPAEVSPTVPPSLGYEEPRFEGSAESFPFHLHVYESIGLSDGRGANLPWLQELPDPLTTAVWGSWVEINPSTADRLGVGDGDPVWVESPAGKILAPALRFPGAMPNVVSIPVGQGHSAYGRYANGIGASPLEILAPLTDARSGSLAHGATRVKISRAGGVAKLVKIERIPGKPEERAFFE